MYVGILWKVGNTHKIAVIPVEVDEFSGRRSNALKTETFHPEAQNSSAEAPIDWLPQCPWELQVF